MTDSDARNTHPLASQVVLDSAVDQDLDWLIKLECATVEQQLQFNDWLKQNPAHRMAFIKARAIWDSPVVHSAARRIADL